MKKQTAVEWLIGRFHYEGFIGTFCSDELIKSKREIMIEIIDQAKEMEQDHIQDAFYFGVDVDSSKVISPYKEAEKYYQETYDK
jgi:hypothetical protein